MTRSIYYKSRYKKFKYNRFRNNNFIKYKIVALIISFIGIMSIITFFPHFIRNTYNLTITHKQVVKHNNIDRYLIYGQTDEGEVKVFEIKDNFLELKFNSEDLYLALSISKRYEVRAYGFSMPLLFGYQNIVSARGI
jgi:hypothetical protein